MATEYCNLPWILPSSDVLNNQKIPRHFRNYPDYDIAEFEGKAGKEHYRLLTWLSHQFNNSVILDIGSHRGFSALSLASNKSNTIYSFDIIDKINAKLKEENTNIKFLIDNLFTDEGWEKYKDLILSSAFIMLDIDPHDGILEYEFYEKLRDNGYQGFIILDDIWYFKNMRNNLWYKIPPQFKQDISDWGHWSGTGFVTFTRNNINYKEASNRNCWTFVTAYFDLTKCPDASQSIKDRPAQHYLENARSTMALNANLVIYGEEETLDILRSMRPEWLQDNTKYITANFEDFPLTPYRDKIIQNRKEHPYPFDDRNTASYYLFCMSRYAMLKEVIENNPFNSTHFAWLNICIERMGYKNVKYLENVIKCPRDKFSTCYIDYIPESRVHNYPDYWGHPSCSMCSGFFSGNAYYMENFCNAVEEKFIHYLELGYGHADEQLYSPVYFEHPDWFSVYYGDYFSMITNYDGLRDDLRTTIAFFLVHTVQHKDFKTGYRAVKWIWDYCMKENKGHTSCLGELRTTFLTNALICAQQTGHDKFATKALIELKCVELGY